MEHEDVPFLAAAFLYNIVQMNVGYGIQLHLANDRVAQEGREVGLWLRDHAPPGSDIAEAMQENSEKPYIIASTGLRRLSSNFGLLRMSLMNHVPSSARRRKISSTPNTRSNTERQA